MFIVNHKMLVTVVSEPLHRLSLYFGLPEGPVCQGRSAGGLGAVMPDNHAPAESRDRPTAASLRGRAVQSLIVLRPAEDHFQNDC